MAASKPSLDISVIVGFAPWRRSVRGPAALCRDAADAAFAAAAPASLKRRPLDLAVLLADDATLRDLNHTYRGKDKPTNVLSFVDGDDMAAPDGAARHLGDIALAFETVAREAREQKKALRHHLTHLVVHGTLHLLGHDHEVPAEAEAMEDLERRVLRRLGIADPYAWRGGA